VPARGADVVRRHATSIYSASESSTGLMGSRRVRRHPHPAIDPAPACGFSCGPRACGSGSPCALCRLAWGRRRHFGNLLKFDK
jgi:hypothetical protein